MTSLEPSVVRSPDVKISPSSGHGKQSLSRSPHPYHRRSESLTQSDVRPDFTQGAIPGKRHFSSSSDSGTEADDERGTLLKGLPAPPLRAHKGLRGATPFVQSPALSPLPSPPAIENDGRKSFFGPYEESVKVPVALTTEQKEARYKYARRKKVEIVRRGTETALLACVGVGLWYGSAEQLYIWVPELLTFILAIGVLCAAYPVRHMAEFWQRGSPLTEAVRRGFRIPSRFDLGNLLYPVFLPGLVAASFLHSEAAFLIPNLILGLSSIPVKLLPSVEGLAGTSYASWVISVLPLATSRFVFSSPYVLKTKSELTLPAESTLLLQPLQHALVPLLKFLTTTSLDPAELALLSTALINVLLFGVSPQVEILKSLLWLGGIVLLVTCSHIMSWEVALARIPGWRFKRRKSPSRGVLAALDYQICEILAHQRFSILQRNSSDEDEVPQSESLTRTISHTLGLVKINDALGGGLVRRSRTVDANGSLQNRIPMRNQRRNTLSSQNPHEDKMTGQNQKKRRKPSVSPAASSFLSLSPSQARVRKWLYAALVYFIVIATILLPIRRYISTYALSGYEPFGWATGYLLGNISELRFFVVSNNLESWIRLPLRVHADSPQSHLGWIEHVRQVYIGPATVRLVLCAYCILVLLTGIAVVLRLTSVVEVDTRRKVFHGIMVVMLLPTIFVDPCFIALALILILAIFLLLDLFRASQLPPISRPLTHFLAPYVDGRDHRGPVVVSHIFLLIGCAIPLWLSLSGINRTGLDPWAGWEVDLRDLSMISGVVCVGMGDAAASLVGRRYGKTKWYWGGGKSLEGSGAFAGAVTIGLFASWLWLRLGGWVIFSEGFFQLVIALGKCVVAGTGASMLEATLTAANDNVVVPIGLWLLVRVLQI